MNNAIRSGFRIVKTSVSNSTVQNVYTRLPIRLFSITRLNGNIMFNHSFPCLCVCGSRKIHSRGREELIEFLTGEVELERKMVKTTIPSRINDFQVHLNGSDVSLSKMSDKETIEIRFNINNSVEVMNDTDFDNESIDNEYVEMKSRPDFDIVLKRNNMTLLIACSYVEHLQPEEEEEDEKQSTQTMFGINEVAIYEGDFKDSYYSVSGSMLNPKLYEILMNYLHEKGISNQLINKMSNLSTSFEHATYTNFLSDLQKFVSHK